MHYSERVLVLASASASASATVQYCTVDLSSTALWRPSQNLQQHGRLTDEVEDVENTTESIDGLLE